MNVYTSLQNDTSYKTIELEPELLDIVTKNQEPLYFKAPNNNNGFAVLCSKNQTFQLKRKNHSNTVIAAYHEFTEQDSSYNEASNTYNLGQADIASKKIVGVTSFDSDFECSLSKGTIDTMNLPVYNGQIGFQPNEYQKKISVEELRDNSPISENEFEQVFSDLKGSEVNDRFTSEALNIIIVTILATTGSFSSISIPKLYESIGDASKFSYSVVKTVITKFAATTAGASQDLYTLDEKAVATWYGIEALKSHAKKLIAPNEFLIKWKGMFPQLYSVPIELSWLCGYFARPLSNRIQYFPKHFLSKDAKERFKELFAVQSSWELEEITPFVEELNVKKLKIEKFIIKYARKRNEGKKVVVMAR